MPACSNCGSAKTAIRGDTGKEIWFFKKDPNRILCQSCFIKKQWENPTFKNQQIKHLIGNTYRKGQPCSDLHKKRIGNANRGKKHSEQSRRNMSLAHIGNHQTAESRAKIAAKMKEIAPFKGKKLHPHVIEIKRQKRLLQVFPKKDSAPEVVLQNALVEVGIKFETHKAIIGQPDIFIEPNVCIFVDGDHWHGNPMKYKPDDILTGGMKASERWEKDRKVNDDLQSRGYTVLRFWESQIKTNLPDCVQKIITQVS